MKLILKDIATDQVVVKIPVKHVIDQHFAYWVVDFDSPTYKNFSFQIDCALYGMNEGQTMSDTIENEDGESYVQWFVI